MEAINIMKKTSSIETRAEQFGATIKRNLQKSFIDPLVDNIEKMEDQIQTLLDFNLDTDLNKGVKPVTRVEAQDRFNEVLNLRYELDLLQAELKAKKAGFDKYFGNDKE